MNTDSQGHPVGATVELTTLADSLYPLHFAATITRTLTEDGTPLWGLTSSWEDPELPRYVATRILLLNYQGPGSVQVLTGDNPVGERVSVCGAWPYPAAATPVRVAIQAIYGDGTAAELAGCPGVDLTIEKPAGEAGVEYADLVTNLRVALSDPAYGLNADGQKVLWLTVFWDPPSDPRYGGGSLWIIRNGTHHQLGGLDRDRFFWETTYYPQAPEPVVFYVLSVDANNRRNSHVESVTPALNLTLPAPDTGPAGREYTSLVSGFAVTVANPPLADGTAAAVVTCTFTPPVDVSWAGIEIRTSEDAGSTWATRAKATKSPVIFELPLGITPVTFRVGGFSFDVNGKLNSYLAGVTPTQDILVGSTAGQLDLSKAKPTSYDSNIFTIQNGKLKIWAFDGSLIVSGTVSSAALNAAEVMVGGGGSKPGKLGVYNAAGQRIGFVGVEGSEEGIWAAKGAFGGSGFASANFRADSSGAYITDSVFSLCRTENPGQSYQQVYYARINSAFNAGLSGVTFTGLEIARAQSGWKNRAVLIARGLVVFNNAGYQVASLAAYNGDPTGQDNATEFWGQLALYNASGSMKVLLNGADGEMRTYGHLNILNSAWNTGRLKLGSYHLWVDGSGRLRIKNSDPTSDTDGTVVGAQS